MQNTSTFETPIEISGTQDPIATVVWLHGLGADGHDFETVVDMLNLPQIRFILPHAPYRKVTLNNGYEMRAWYDLFGLTPDSPQDVVGIEQSRSYIQELIANENARGIPESKIILSGFSQGGAIALHTACRQNQALAGVLALSTYLPLRPMLASERTIESLRTPIFMAHGSHDDVISLATCKLSLEALLAQGYRLDWHEYEMAHGVCKEEIADIRTFLLDKLQE